MFTDCFSRIYIWSPSINVDSKWKPVKDYIHDRIKPGDSKIIYFDRYEASEVEQAIKTQQQVIDYQKEQKHKHLYKIFILVDGFVDDPRFTRTSQLLH